MSIHQILAPEGMAPGKRTPVRASRLPLLLARLVAWAKHCADYYAAATAYEELLRLSDVELKHRGLSRDILARDLSAWRDH